VIGICRDGDLLAKASTEAVRHHLMEDAVAKVIVLASSACVVAAFLACGGRAAAAPLQDVPGPQQEQDLLRELVSWPDGMHEGIADLHGDIGPLSFGTSVHWYEPSEAFRTGSVTQSLQSELVLAEGGLLMAVRRDGNPIGVLEAFKSVASAGEWYMGSAMGDECGEAVAALEPGERLLLDILGTQDSLWIVRGNDLEELTVCNIHGPAPAVNTLTDYQQYIFSFYAPGEGYYGGGAWPRLATAVADGPNFKALLLGLVAVGSVGAIGAIAIRLMKQP
jgi:hypothetical protein